MEEVLYSPHIFILLKSHLHKFIFCKNRELENFLKKCNYKFEILYLEKLLICNHRLDGKIFPSN